jgi:hypothetical protein
MKICIKNLAVLGFVFICLASCVSKKKYVKLQNDAAQKQTAFESERALCGAKNDSLKAALAAKDQLIDSVTYRLNLFSKHEKEKIRPDAGTVKKNSMTKKDETEKKSLFIYNFTKHIEWPIEYNGTEFVIGVAGDNQSVEDLKSFMITKKVSGKKIIVEKFKKGARYNLVYVTSQQMADFSIIKNSLRKNKTVLVTDEAVQGSHISFLIDNDKVRYFVDKAEIEKCGLKVGQELLRYAG